MRHGVLGKLGVSLLPLAAAPACAQTPTQTMLSCTDFTKSDDEAALVKRFGRENVASVKLDGAEGETVRGTAIFPKDPARRLEVYWRDEAKRRGLATIALRRGSAWAIRTPAEVRPTIGIMATVGDIEAANGRPFLISGFGWDYGGFGVGWKGGALERMEGGCTIGVRFNPDPKAKAGVLAKVSGEKQFGSSDPAMRAAKPTLSSITLDWPE